MIVEVRMPGAVWRECFDPSATDVPGELGLPEPERIRAGRGWQLRYQVEHDVAEQMLDHAETFGEAISFGVDDGRAGRTIVRWVENERARIGMIELDALAAAGEYDGGES